MGFVTKLLGVSKATIPSAYGPHALGTTHFEVGDFAITNESMNDALLTDAPPGSCSACLVGAVHLNFTDMNHVAMMSRALGSIDRGEMARSLRAMTVGFFDHLKGRALTGFTPSGTLRVKGLTARP